MTVTVSLVVLSNIKKDRLVFSNKKDTLKKKNFRYPQILQKKKRKSLSVLMKDN